MLKMKNLIGSLAHKFHSCMNLLLGPRAEGAFQTKVKVEDLKVLACVSQLEIRFWNF